MNIASMTGSVGCHCDDGCVRVVNWSRMDWHCVRVMAMRCVANHVRSMNKNGPVMHVCWMMCRMHKSCMICADMVSRGRMLDMCHMSMPVRMAVVMVTVVDKVRCVGVSV